MSGVYLVVGNSECLWSAVQWPVRWRYGDQALPVSGGCAEVILTGQVGVECTIDTVLASSVERYLAKTQCCYQVILNDIQDEDSLGHWRTCSTLPCHLSAITICWSKEK